MYKPFGFTASGAFLSEYRRYQLIFHAAEVAGIVGTNCDTPAARDAFFRLSNMEVIF